MNPYFLVGLGGLALFVYCCYKKTPQLAPAQTDDPLADKTTFVGQYSDPDDTWSDPSNLTTNPCRVSRVRSETGPFGVPRNLYKGPGNSKLYIYGKNYESL